LAVDIARPTPFPQPCFGRASALAPEYPCSVGSTRWLRCCPQSAGAFIQEIQCRNAKIQIIGGQEAIAVLNENNLADAWANFLVGYSTSGLPNTRTLHRVAELLEVDALIIGAIIHINHEDSNGWTYPITQVSIRYTMFGGKDGDVLWELTGEGKVRPYSWTAVPIFDAAKLTHDKILGELPF